MSNIGVGRGKLYLRRGRRGRFPRDRLPRRVQRLLGVGLLHDDLRYRFAGTASNLPRLDPRGGMIDGPRLVPGLGVDDLAALAPRLRADHLARRDAGIGSRQAATRLRRVRRTHGADDVLDLDQSRDGDEQVDAGGRDAHARPKAKRGAGAAPCRTRRIAI